ncbi:hypothetical protein CYMTET_48893 [Cymbomonas tetramitiformis]|uniref:Reverse transcriptase domain-containing protein n=1 Tax=Cymbomonas tetramitiformis TaxID=36881 RepID=A0AAE0EUN8_9CHLO|nr:hypothetical protein CYMTET_48893 [Cymbomonas tetramitiformis]
MVTEFFSSRGRHSVQFDDDGQVMQVHLSNSRALHSRRVRPDGPFSRPRPGVVPARRVGGRSDLGGGGEPPVEVCEAPIMEDGDPVGELGGAGRLPIAVVGGSPEACEAPIVEEGEEELGAVDRGLLRPERVVHPRGAAYLSDGEVVYHRIARGTLVTPSLHAVFAAGLVGEDGEIMDPVPIIQVMEVEEDSVASGRLGVAEAATALPAEVVRAEYVEADGGAVDRPGYVRGPAHCSPPWAQEAVAAAAPPPLACPPFGVSGAAGNSADPSPRPLAQGMGGSPAGGSVRRRGARRSAEARDGDPPPGEDEPSFRCPGGGGGDAGGEAGGGMTANRAQRRERLVDPVIPEASWEWLRGLPLEEVFACLFSTARHVPKRAKNAYAEAMSLVKEGQLAKAIGRLDPGVLAPLQPETLEALAELHTAGDGLPAQVQAAPLVLEEAAVEAECRRLPVASGPGCSQLRFEHLGAIFGAGDGVHAIKHACEQLVSNRVPSGILPWLMGARLVALLKPGGGVRPIACGETLRRLTGKVVCRQMRMRFASQFGAPPEGGASSSAAQVGVGVPGGAEVCVHTVQALLGSMPTWCALQLDCKNAFNTVHRRAIFQAVYEDFPELLGLTESCFRHEARLRWRGADGTFHWVSSAEGAQQGDPLGPFFMAAPLQPVLQAALRAHPDVYIIAYLDDIHILGEPDRARAAYDTIVPSLEGIGLDLNVGKSAIFSPSGAVGAFRDVVDSAGRSMPGAVEPLEGIKVLGVPIGSDAWVADKCFEIAAKAGSILPKLARLNDPQVQLLLLRYCAHPRFMHLVRGVQPHLLMRGGLEHDAGIHQQCLQEVAGSPYPLGEEAVAISQLPTRWGGLGLTSAQRLAPAGWLGSWAHAWKKMVVMFPAVRDLLPHLGAPEGTDFGGHPLVAGLAAAMEDVRGARARVLAAEREEHPVPEGLQIPAEAPGWEGFDDDRPASRKELTIYQHGSDWLRLFDAANPSVRARLLSLSRDGATWHLNALPEEGGFRLKPIAAVISLCLQLGTTIPLVREVSAVGTGRFYYYQYCTYLLKVEVVEAVVMVEALEAVALAVVVVEVVG